MVAIAVKNLELINRTLDYKLNVPHIIKYMGSKRDLLKYLLDSISEIHEREIICDLFAGTSVLSGALGHDVIMYSNDIQKYSAVFAKTYLGNYNWKEYEGVVEEIVKMAQKHVNYVSKIHQKLNFIYNKNLSLNEFNALEQQQQELIYNNFEEIKNHLFIKYYSGTYWSYEQCLWIDAIRATANKFVDTPIYYPILSSLMYAMAYNAQSTGHYAQYRSAINESSMNDIIFYRNKKILPYFTKKMYELINYTGENKLNHHVTSLDYSDCLDTIPEETLVYADPPYAFVHYSRFYHALETLVRYDYPKVLYKGRYRNDRHQSPFCKRTEVSNAFEILFQKVKKKNSKLVLSYSNTGMIGLNQVLNLATAIFSKEYKVYKKEVAYKHSTMGRVADKSREVKEFLIIAKPK